VGIGTRAGPLADHSRSRIAHFCGFALGACDIFVRTKVLLDRWTCAAPPCGDLPVERAMWGRRNVPGIAP
jgi:hypothetical protein